MKRRLIVLFLIVCVLFTLYGCGATDKINTLMSKDEAATEDILLSNIPMMDKEKYNRFTIKGQITATNVKEETEHIFIDSALEIYRNISHLFRTTVTFPDSNAVNAESWADFSSYIRYNNIKESGFQTANIKDQAALDMLVYAINNRPDAPDFIVNEEVCTISWNFDTDVNMLFGDLVSHLAANTELSGNGRIMAVFDPATYKFSYFNVIVSANNEERTGALLDMTFQWDVINSETEALIIPIDVTNSAYLASTGVTTNGGYDPVVNKMAEDFIVSYAGNADVSHYDNGACMFWTLNTDGISAAVNYERSSQADLRYEESHEFFKLRYGQPVETTDNGSYFFDKETDELIYIAEKDGLYAEIIITGKDKTQGELRKPLIIYKSRLDM